MLRRPAIAGLVSLLIVAVLVAPASAGRLWCKADPVVSLDDRLVSITVAIPLDYLLLVNGPTQITIRTPPSITHDVVVNDLGFNGHGTEIRFVEGGGAVKEQTFPVEVRVTVPVDRSNLAPDEVVPLEVTVMPDNTLPITVVGTAEETVVDLTVTGR